MSEQSVNYSGKYQQLLFDLKITVEGLLAGRVANVWTIYGGLNRLFNSIEKIFKHGCKSLSTDSTSDYWQFIQGLDWLQPNTKQFSLVSDCEFQSYLPQHLKSDKAAIWLYRSIENHSLSQKLSWLISDEAHLQSCYQSQAFLRQEKYAESVLICLHAVERNQTSLLTDINPNLFVSKTNVKEYHKIHRRCSSYPDNHTKLSESQLVQSKTSQNLHSYNFKPQLGAKGVHGKFKPWKSLPDLAFKQKDWKSVTNTRTAPNTPTHVRHFSNDGVTKIKSSLKSQPHDATAKKVKHVIINNEDIIEHRPHNSDAPSRDFDNLSVKSLTEQSPARKKNLPDYGFGNVLSGEKDYKKKPKKTFIEDGGMSILPMASGYFPQPIKGQTLTSFLTSSQFARGNAELDRENAHFSISEAIISAIEHIRSTSHLRLVEEHGEESDEEIIDLKQRIRLRRRQKLVEKSKIYPSYASSSGNFDQQMSPCSSSSKCRSESSTSDDSDLSKYEVDSSDIDLDLFDHRGLSTSMASLYSESDLYKRAREAPDGASDIFSAESVALSLISRFDKKQLPKASDLQWLVSEEDAPQELLPLPKSWPISPDELGESSITPLRGTNEWAPPRPQIICTSHPRPDRSRRKKLMEKQNYRCAGCGMRVAIQYSSKFRYCNYVGRYFCTGCHTNQLAVIPGRVIEKWDFTRYEVSNFFYRLLEQMFVDPLFRILELNPNLWKRSKNLVTCRNYRYGLYYLKDFIYTCRFARDVQKCLEVESTYIISDPDVYSMRDLVSIRNGELKAKLGGLVELCCKHVHECELCLARGFVCEACLSDEVLFPWQLRRVARCYKCGSCYHAKCWNADKTPCIKCVRISKRRSSNNL